MELVAAADAGRRQTAWLPTVSPPEHDGPIAA